MVKNMENNYKKRIKLYGNRFDEREKRGKGWREGEGDRQKKGQLRREILRERETVRQTRRGERM